MNYLDRYMAGQYEQVWGDLQALGHAVREKPHYDQARDVAAETMRRVRRNCERLVSKLRGLGYVFDTYPDEVPRLSCADPLTPPSKGLRADCADVEAKAGPLPLSLVAFWHEVGGVDLVGMHPSWSHGLDPLVVYPPEGDLTMLCDQEDQADGVRFFTCLAPDDLHKDNYSGGAPYGVYLPNPCADFVFVNEWHRLHFVPYLRLAILEWGGFPGLAERGEQFEPLKDLIAGLEPF